MHRLWIAFVLVLLVSFMILGWIGTRINAEKPPIPERVVTTEGTVLIDDGQIESGQNVWQSMGGMEVGSIWGLFSDPVVILDPVYSLNNVASRISEAERKEIVTAAQEAWETANFASVEDDNGVWKELFGPGFKVED